MLDALDLRAKQFRSRDGIWPFRVPHEPLDLGGVVDRALDGEAGVDLDTLRSRTVLELTWAEHRWQLWALTLPSGIHLYGDADGSETRILASVKRGNPGEADGFFLERLAQSRGHDFGIEMTGPPPGFPVCLAKCGEPSGRNHAKPAFVRGSRIRIYFCALAFSSPVSPLIASL